MRSRTSFAERVVCSTEFLGMSVRAQCLYFALCMRADDDGFVGSPKPVMQIISATETELSELVSKKYIISFDDGVIAIRHWFVNNCIRKVTYTPSVHQDKKRVILPGNGKIYNVPEESGENEEIGEQPTEKPDFPEVKVGPPRKGPAPPLMVPPSSPPGTPVSFPPYNPPTPPKDTPPSPCARGGAQEKRETPDYQRIMEMYNTTCRSYPRLTRLSEDRRKAIRARLTEYSMEDFQRLFDKAEKSSFLRGQNDRNWTANFDWLIRDRNMARVLDGNYDNGKGPGGAQKPKYGGSRLDVPPPPSADWSHLKDILAPKRRDT